MNDDDFCAVPKSTEQIEQCHKSGIKSSFRTIPSCGSSNSITSLGDENYLLNVEKNTKRQKISDKINQTMSLLQDNSFECQDVNSVMDLFIKDMPIMSDIKFDENFDDLFADNINFHDIFDISDSKFVDILTAMEEEALICN